jgi:hypothetical protein
MKTTNLNYGTKAKRAELIAKAPKVPIRVPLSNITNLQRAAQAAERKKNLVAAKVSTQFSAMFRYRGKK